MSQEITNTLASLQLDDDPKALALPPFLWNGPSGVTSGDLVSLEKDAYEVLVRGVQEDVENAINLRAGSACVSDDDGEMKLMRVRAI